VSLDAAYAECERVAREHYENFPVASFLVPARMRPHIAAIYAFARAADDFADEGARTNDERLALLDDWEARLDACVEGPSPEPRAPSPGNDAVFLALGATIRDCRLPLQLFRDLLSAFRQDVTTRRYDSWPEVMDYCRRSADPVGRLVLRVAGYESAGLDAASDALCSALQLTNFWQDLARDWQNGRLYVPREDLQRFGAREEDLDRRLITPAWRGVLGEMASRTRTLFGAGRPVCDGVTGRLRYELRVTWLGGSFILSRLEANGYDVFASRPALKAPDVLGLAWQAATWSRPDAA